MWRDLIDVNQVVVGKRIRKVILEGEHQHETIYNVSKLGEFYFFAQMIEHNGIILRDDQQIILPYKLANILYHGFEIWEEENV